MKSTIILDKSYFKAKVGNRVFGSFIEHLGRAVYGGIYEPGHKTADKNGYRQDVLGLIRELSVPMIRYPGGNFVSAFQWEDSVGPVENRPRRLDLAWATVEPNTFGLKEYMEWAKLAGTETMMALNLGTRGIDAARNLVEYCNHPKGSYWSDLRRSHGSEDPYDIQLWCLGNEMDGPWQVGHKTAEEYGRLASEVGKAIKLFDPKLELVACGSSHDRMPTFLEWESTVLDHCYETVDYVSMHCYYKNPTDDLATYLGSSVGMDRFIANLVHTCDYVKAKKHSKKTMNLSFDEWNVWFHSAEADQKAERWIVGRPLLEDVYTFEDALIIGMLMNSLMRNADRVKIACLAQLVNVIAPIMTRTGGGSWKQTIYWPFYYASLYGRGLVLDPRIDVPSYENPVYDEIPYLDTTVVWHEESEEIVFFAVNRHQTESLDIEARLGGFGDGFKVIERVELTHPDVKAVNTEQNPDEVAPKSVLTSGKEVDGEYLRIALKPLSWNMIRLGRKG